MEWEATAPANLALIKYMGKKEFLFEDSHPVEEKTSQPSSHSLLRKDGNVALNSSLSFTLPYLSVKVKISKRKSTPEAEDEWRPLCEKGFQIELPLAAQKRFLRFFDLLKRAFHIKGGYRVQSGGNFPVGCGLASSAAGFAALTLAAYRLAKTAGFLKEGKTLRELSQLSRQGSGSSCRSFFSPWCLWRPDRIESLNLPDLLHQVIILEDRPKKSLPVRPTGGFFQALCLKGVRRGRKSA